MVETERASGCLKNKRLSRTIVNSTTSARKEWYQIHTYIIYYPETQLNLVLL